MENQVEKSLSPHHRLSIVEMIILADLSILIFIVGWFVLHPYNQVLYSDIPILYRIFSIITQLGSEYAFIVLFVLIYIMLDKEFAKRLIVGFLITTHFTTFCKQLVQDPRPPSNWRLDPENPIETGYGWPSGHTSGSVGFWGYIFFSFQGYERKTLRWIIQILAGLILILVPISRIIIGAHDIEDVVGGYMIGFVILQNYLFFEPKVSALKLRLGMKIFLGILCSLVLWFGFGGLLLLFNPEEGMVHFNELAQTGGLLIGISIVFPLESRFVHFNPKELVWPQKILGGLIALVLTLGIYFGLSLAFKLLESFDFYFIIRGFRYFTLALVAGLGAPWLLTKIFKKK